MTERTHSPAPFSRSAGATGYIIRDAFGDSIAGLALKTGDHPPEEQRANSLLFTASPRLLAVLTAIVEAWEENGEISAEQIDAAKDVIACAVEGEEDQPYEPTARLPAGAIMVLGEPHLRDHEGKLVPISIVKAEELLEHELVSKVTAFAVDLNAQIARFKGHTMGDIGAHGALLDQEYDVQVGGAKGNMTFQNFDQTAKVALQVANVIDFSGSSLQSAKLKVDECLTKWGADSRPEIRAIVQHAFAVGQAGRINRSALLSLMRFDIDDPDWKQAMRALNAAIKPKGTKEYLRFYRRPTPKDEWEAITIDLAAA